MSCGSPGCDCGRTDGFSVVFVDWLDSCENRDNSDQTVYELPSPQRLFYVGFMVHEEDDHVVIASGIKPELETFDYAIAIPRVAINNIRHLTMCRPEQDDM
tara:strand:+ start:729 stop:1031 length:303 start_codon:yes stop_codon:yes gene_type:complete